MTSLELLVRPFQSKDVTPPKRIIGSEKTVDPVSVSIGSSGGTAFVYRDFKVSEFKVEDSFTYKEVERKTEIKRVENPDDPSMFVEVERVVEIVLRNKLKPEDKRVYEIKNND